MLFMQMSECSIQDFATYKPFTTLCNKFLGFREVLRKLSNIYNGDFCDNNSQLLDVNYFRKKAPSQILERVLNDSLGFFYLDIILGQFIQEWTKKSLRKTAF